MQLRLIYIIFLLLATGMSCTSNSSQELEQQVVADIFPELIKETFEDRRKWPLPPPPPPAPRMTENEKKKSMEDHQKYLDTTKFAPLHIVVNDSVIGYSEKWLKRWHHEDERLKFIDTSYVKKSFKIDLSKIKLSEDYILKYKSELELPIEELKNKERLKYSVQEKHLWQYIGTLYLHRIYFDKDQNYGVMQVGYNCGKLCGCGYIVFIKKLNNKWQIDKIESTGCA